MENEYIRQCFTASLSFLEKRIVLGNACSRRDRRGPHPALGRTDQTSGSAYRSRDFQALARGAESAASADALADPEVAVTWAVMAVGGTAEDTVQDRPSDRWDLDRRACRLAHRTPALKHGINLGRTELYYKKMERRGRVSLPS